MGCSESAAVDKSTSAQKEPRQPRDDASSDVRSRRSSLSPAHSHGSSAAQQHARQSIQYLEDELRKERSNSTPTNTSGGTYLSQPQPQQQFIGGGGGNSVSGGSTVGPRKGSHYSEVGGGGHSAATLLPRKSNSSNSLRRRESDDTLQSAAEKRNPTGGSIRGTGGENNVLGGGGGLSPGDMYRNDDSEGGTAFGGGTAGGVSPTSTKKKLSLIMTPSAQARTESRNSLKINPSTPFDLGASLRRGTDVQRIQDEIDGERRITHQGELCFERENPVWWQELLEANRHTNNNPEEELQTLANTPPPPPPKVPASLAHRMQLWLDSLDSRDCMTMPPNNPTSPTIQALLQSTRESPRQNYPAGSSPVPTATTSPPLPAVEGGSSSGGVAPARESLRHSTSSAPQLPGQPAF